MKVLSVSAAEEDHSAVRLCLCDVLCDVIPAKTCTRAVQLLDHSEFSIVVCDSNLPDGTWRNVLEHFRHGSETPILIVSSHRADGNLWAEVLNLGGFDVIAKPFRASELRHVLETARLEMFLVPHRSAAATTAA